ncbi:MAG TPA: hypothetical protein PLT00_15455 [Verrucomicrobiota bacterium]|jgi:hypothetical protein|nr:hypothetical protein [Verrucomicrobiota bacterium]OQB88787.1 MAG: hypothetical protein BWX84_02768 [Verrucomicrobia bacterium ADurb.Bin118]HPY31888.1 hypothetical protein [Verrucomicrobiota bacterium]HQB18095.1 hypothetical protein [Verrucomicrobiota bacterium]
MQTATSPILLFALLAGIPALAAIVVAFRMRPARQSRIGFIVAVSPSLLMLAFFYSLAIHMHQSLGAWPTSIGERGFPAPLITHASIATGYFGILLLVSIFAWPVAFLLCLLIRRWRVCLYYLGVYALACLLCFGAMLLAPSQFLYWWWD